MEVSGDLIDVIPDRVYLSSQPNQLGHEFGEAFVNRLNFYFPIVEDISQKIACTSIGGLLSQLCQLLELRLIYAGLDLVLEQLTFFGFSSWHVLSSFIFPRTASSADGRSMNLPTDSGRKGKIVFGYKNTSCFSRLRP
jgi:hypothetical protein